MTEFTPRTKTEIEQSLLARLVAQSKLTDVNAGDVGRHLIGTTAEEFEAVEFRVKRVRDGFRLQGLKGADVDARLKDLNLTRLGKTAASGAVLKVTRGSAVGTLDLPAGSTYTRSDNPAVIYVQTVGVTMGVGELIYPPNDTVDPISVICVSRGEVGNCGIGAIDVGLNVPSDVLSVTNTEPLDNGQDRETDAEALYRAYLYLSSLARSQPPALEFLARTFVASDGTRVLHAQVWEDPDRPGYSELVVDDGFGFVGAVDKGAEVTGTVPANGQRTLWHQSPATNPITTIQVDTGAGFVAVNTPSGGVQQWTSLEERGLLHTIAGLLSPGDDWKINNYLVYTGLIRELQATVEGDPADRLNKPGWRASGTRVRVVPPTVNYVAITYFLVGEADVGLTSLIETVNAEIIGYLRTLPPGEPLFRARLTARVMALDGVRNFIVNAPAEDYYPSSARGAIRTKSELITAET